MLSLQDEAVFFALEQFQPSWNGRHTASIVSWGAEIIWGRLGKVLTRCNAGYSML